MKIYSFNRLSETPFHVKNACFAALLLFPLFLLGGCHAIGGSFGAKDNSNRNFEAPTAQPTAAVAPGVSPTAQPNPDDLKTQKNLLAFGAGAMVVDQTSQSEDTTQNARRVIDEASFYWQSAEGKIENQSITLELPAATVLKTVGFDTAQPTYYDQRAAKDVLVEVAPDSPASGFQTILAATLADDKDGQNYPVEREIPARFVRITARSNHGSPARILIKEIRGYGEQEAPPSIPNVSGTYKFEDYGELRLKQEGALVLGCYQYNEGVVEGTIDGRTLTLTRAEGDGTKGFAAVNFSPDGKKFAAALWNAGGGSKDYDVLRAGEKTSDKIGGCKQFPDLDAGSRDAGAEKLAAQLEKSGRAVLYGINFDFNSDKIRDESRPPLEKVVALLKQKPDWRLTIEGHTDNIGGGAFNQTLSEKRAAAVKNYLISAGIEASRLTTSGLGLSKPVAGNDTEAGRAQNRRVELVKQ